MSAPSDWWIDAPGKSSTRSRSFLVVDTDKVIEELARACPGCSKPYKPGEPKTPFRLFARAAATTVHLCPRCARRVASTCHEAMLVLEGADVAGLPAYWIGPLVREISRNVATLELARKIAASPSDPNTLI